MTTPGFWRQVEWVIRKDLRVELRGGETLWMATPFAALALLLAPLALGTDTALLRRIGPGMLWLVVLLFGMTVTLRPASLESRPVRDLLTLNGLDPAAGFAGRSLASAVLLLGVTLVLTPVMIVLYAPAGEPRWGWLIMLAGGGHDRPRPARIAGRYPGDGVCGRALRWRPSWPYRRPSPC